MNSIRRRLLVGLLGALTVTGFIAAAGVYLKARDEANVLFDYQLKQIALSLRDHAATALAVAGAAPDSAEQEVVIQIWDDTGLHLYRSHPESPPLPQAAPGLTTVTMPQGAWRVFNLLGYHDNVIQVAQQLHADPEQAWRRLKLRRSCGRRC